MWISKGLRAPGFATGGYYVVPLYYLIKYLTVSKNYLCSEMEIIYFEIRKLRHNVILCCCSRYSYIVVIVVNISTRNYRLRSTKYI